jgi:predicted secreted Zn-dependent protease
MRRPAWAIPIVGLLVLAGCATVVPTAQRERVMLKTTSAIRYYPIRGTSTTAIFDEIDKNGLFDSNGRRAVGLTSAEWNMDWKGVEARPGLCGQDSMTITLNLVVSLPEHKRSTDLPQNIRASWQQFAAGVAVHEQRHVDIYLNGARRMKSRMEAILTKPASCSQLGDAIRALWVGQQADIEKAQNQFHVEEDAKSHDHRKPLQSQIEVNQKRLSVLDSDIRGLDQALETLKRRSETTLTELDAVKLQMGKSGASSSACGQSGLTSRLLALCQRHNTLVTTYNSLVEQHNGTVARRNSLADEHDRIAATTNTLIEALNWTR